MIKSVIKRILFCLLYFFYKIPLLIIFAVSFWKGELSYLSKEDFRIWRRSMCKMLKEYWVKGHYGLCRRKIVLSFCNSRFEVIRKTAPCDKHCPIVTLCVKNDKKRIQMLVDHYRTLGIVKFAIMDNGSDDGTFEWLLEQQDIDLYQCKRQYQTNVKEGWINRLISYYGFDRWYVVTDSDELAVYQNMETRSLPELTMRLERAGVKRVKAITLDTYSESAAFIESDNIRNDYRWIDSDSYKEMSVRAGGCRIKRFIGGPRYRLMNSKVPLDKCPLVYFEKGTVSDDAHYQFPHNIINDAPCLMGILHYKFLDTDLEEYKRRASAESTFVGHGALYRQYMAFFDGSGRQSFMYDGSVEFVSSESLKMIPFIEWSMND